MKVAFTGDRHWKDWILVNETIRYFDSTRDEIHVGDEPNGLDHIVWELTSHFNRYRYIAEWKRYGRAAGPRRNEHMLNAEPDVLVAFHDDLNGKSKGTKNCVMQAQRKGILVVLIRHKEGS